MIPPGPVTRERSDAEHTPSDLRRDRNIAGECRAYRSAGTWPGGIMEAALAAHEISPARQSMSSRQSAISPVAASNLARRRRWRDRGAHRVLRSQVCTSRSTSSAGK